MINNKADYYRYIQADAKASGRSSVKAKLYGDEIWKWQLCLRRHELIKTFPKWKKYLLSPWVVWQIVRFDSLSKKLGFSIYAGCFEEGLSIPHRGTIVVNGGARAGKNCRIQEGVNIGSTNGSKAPKLGNNVFIGTGAKIIGDITIADNVAIGANAVVVKSITEPGTTWGGIPAKKISDHDSRSNMPYITYN
jgi:serine O-acetyltransferase